MQERFCLVDRQDIGSSQSVTCSRRGDTPVGAQLAPLPLHVGHQDITFRQEGDWPPLSGSPAVRVGQHALELCRSDLSRSGYSSKGLCITSTPASNHMSLLQAEPPLLLLPHLCVPVALALGRCFVNGKLTVQGELSAEYCCCVLVERGSLSMTCEAEESLSPLGYYKEDC